jgi:hypothetical protein
MGLGDKIKNFVRSKVEEHREEQEYKKEIKRKAKIRAREKYEDQMVEELAEAEVERMKATPKDKMKKFADAFSFNGGSENSEGMASDDKLTQMLGTSTNEEKPKKRKTKKKATKKKVQSNSMDYEDKIKRMLG